MTTQKTAYTYNWPDIIPALLFCLSFFCACPALAQEKKMAETQVTIAEKDKPFPEVLSIIESQGPFKFAYSSELVLRQKNVTVIANDIALPDLLTFLFRGTSVTYSLMGDQVVLQNIALPSKITLSGYIKDSRTGELLIGANIYIPAAGTGISSNNYGFYSITVPSADSMTLEISYVGYKKMIRQVTARDNLTLSFDLAHDYRREEIKGFTIANDKREVTVKKTESAVIDLSSDMIVAAPSVSGSGDLLSSIQMLPGVQAGIDGTPGYCVRGGNTGQNLILLDEATLYNPSHMVGMVGIFNPPAIKHASLIKVGFPASYGGHVSSVLDVAMKDGSNQQFGGVLELGSITSGATLY